MSLRGFNNPYDVLTVMAALKSLIAVDPQTLQPNTNLGQIQAATSKDLIYIQQLYQMLIGPMPAVLIEAMPQKYVLGGRAWREGSMMIKIRYYDSWDNQLSTIDEIKLNNMTDLMRMAANIENNDALTFQGRNYAMSVPTMILSGYEGAIDNKSIPGTAFVRHDLTLMINVLPYDV